MSRSGPNGFSKHCGMSADAIWRSAFKVQAAGETYMWLSMSAQFMLRQNRKQQLSVQLYGVPQYQ